MPSLEPQEVSLSQRKCPPRHSQLPCPFHALHPACFSHAVSLQARGEAASAALFRALLPLQADIGVFLSRPRSHRAHPGGAAGCHAQDGAAAAMQQPCSSPAAPRNPGEEPRGKWDTATKCPWQGGTVPLCHLWGSGTAGCPLKATLGFCGPSKMKGGVISPHGRSVGFSPARRAVPCCVPGLCPQLGHACVAVPA